MAKHYHTRPDVPVRTRLPSGETQEMTEEEWENGFDKLLRIKEEHLAFLAKYFVGNPKATREEASKKLGVSLRTVTRYLQELRKRVEGDVITQADRQMAEKDQRVEKLKQLIKVHPDWTREKYRKAIGVSYRTLLQYFAELPTIN